MAQPTLKRPQSPRNRLGTAGLRGIVLLGALLVGTTAAVAQSAPGLVPKAAGATRLVGSVIDVDGRLDDGAWQGATFVSGFTQKDPEEGQPSTVRTEVAFLYDGGSLYVGARMYTPNPGEIRAQVTRRDNAGNSDRILISLDSYYDKRTAYTFGVTASGVRIDY